MRNGKRVSAIVSGAAALTVLAAGAISAFAYDPVDLKDRAGELKDGVINILADEVYADPGEAVEYRVLIQNNTGYADSGVAINYDAQLTLKTTDGKADIKMGAGAEGLTPSDGWNGEKQLVGIGTIGMTNCTNDGTMYSVTFIVPEDAEPGTEYPMTLKVTKLLDNKTKAVDYTAVNGWIKIRSEETSVTTQVTTTKPVVTTTTKPATDTTEPVTETKTETTTTKPVTGTNPVSDTTTDVTSTTKDAVVTTTTDIASDVTTSISTKKTDRQPGNVTAPNNGSNGGKTTATKTGDSGVGVAAAALLLAGASAAVAKRKKND